MVPPGLLHYYANVLKESVDQEIYHRNQPKDGNAERLSGTVG
jgi:hypothetical protein